jgi:hypothetical protein
MPGGEQAMIDQIICAVLAAGVVGVMFCYSQMRYHEGVIAGLDMAEKHYRKTHR